MLYKFKNNSSFIYLVIICYACEYSYKRFKCDALLNNVVILWYENIRFGMKTSTFYVEQYLLIFLFICTFLISKNNIHFEKALCFYYILSEKFSTFHGTFLANRIYKNDKHIPKRIKEHIDNVSFYNCLLWNRYVKPLKFTNISISISINKMIYFRALQIHKSGVIIRFQRFNPRSRNI